MSIFYSILDSSVLPLCFSSYLAVSFHKVTAQPKQQTDLMLTGKTGYEMLWYYLLALCCVETTSTYQGSVVQEQ